MIEFFRHEAMNQATVIAGFCEIIENLHQDTFSVFRNECAIIGVTKESIMSLDPAGDITGYFSESCSIHFTVLREIAKELDAVARSINAVSIGNGDIYSRYCFIGESAAKLNDLFLFPIAFLQKTIKERRG